MNLKNYRKNPDPENLFEYLINKVPNLDQIVKEEAEKLREEATEIIGDIGK